MNKVKKLARSGWRGGPKPVKSLKRAKAVGRMIAANPYVKRAVGKAKRVGVAAAKQALNEAKHAAIQYGNTIADGAIRSAGATASVVTGNPLPSIGAEGAIIGKDHLIKKYFGTHHNSETSHSGKNYAIKRKPATQYTKPASIKSSPVPTPHDKAASFRNSSHLYSASHPTGAKI